MTSIRSAALQEQAIGSKKKQEERDQMHAKNINWCLRAGLRRIQYALKDSQPQEIRLIAAGPSNVGGRFRVHLLIDGIHFSILEPPRFHFTSSETYGVFVHWHCPACGTEDSQTLLGLEQIGEIVRGKYCEDCAKDVQKVQHNKFLMMIALPTDKEALENLDILVFTEPNVQELSALPSTRPALSDGYLKAITE